MFFGPTETKKTKKNIMVFFLSPLCKRFIMGIIKLMGILINIPMEVGTLLIKQVCK